ncbi:hypothetical protein CRE_25404 [Caenorhabditis remanei]|uniref:Uncharacterized protein n=1 Tax=Caenorhabditis remanei TaxID=31234 RepID=E3LSZ8_CAERE|nr:hypothetical protein CRE_25404 [Caenorhabditis remanei]
MNGLVIHRSITSGGIMTSLNGGYNIMLKRLNTVIHTRRHSFHKPSTECEFSNAPEPEVIEERLSRCEIRNEDAGEIEVEDMSEEMKEFFAKTHDHRRKLKEKREAAEKKKEDDAKKGNQNEYINVEQINVRGRVEKSADHRNANVEFIEKREKAKKDYGIAATKILSMESSIEMQFETEYASNPKLWPNIPLRF